MILWRKKQERERLALFFFKWHANLDTKLSLYRQTLFLSLVCAMVLFCFYFPLFVNRQWCNNGTHTHCINLFPIDIHSYRLDVVVGFNKSCCWRKRWRAKFLKKKKKKRISCLRINNFCFLSLPTSIRRTTTTTDRQTLIRTNAQSSKMG